MYLFFHLSHVFDHIFAYYCLGCLVLMTRFLADVRVDGGRRLKTYFYIVGWCRDYLNSSSLNLVSTPVFYIIYRTYKIGSTHFLWDTYSNFYPRRNLYFRVKLDPLLSSRLIGVYFISISRRHSNNFYIIY